jgi:predicted nicotinamide N-methyase
MAGRLPQRSRLPQLWRTGLAEFCFFYHERDTMMTAAVSDEIRRGTRSWQRLQRRASERFTWHWQRTQVAGRTVALAVPSDPVQLLSDLCHRQARGCSEVIDPFWAQIWRSTEGIDHYLGRRNLAGLRVLELGCGTGAAGMAALMRGANVTFTDGVSAPLLLVRISLTALKVASRWRVRRLRFGCDALAKQQFSLIIGSDISYLKEVWPELLQTLDQHLAHGGEVLLSDPYRSISNEFIAWVRSGQWRGEEHHQALGDAAIRVLKLTRR